MNRHPSITRPAANSAALPANHSPAPAIPPQRVDCGHPAPFGICPRCRKAHGYRAFVLNSRTADRLR